MKLRERERDEAEREDAGRVGDRDGGAEQDGMPRRALRADEVARDECLAVPGRERVGRSPEGGDQEREQDHAGREVAARDEAREAGVGNPVGSLQCLAGGRHRRRAFLVPGSERCGRGGDVERAVQLILGIGAQLVARRRRRHGRGGNCGAVRAVDDDLLPPDPIPVVAVAVGDRRRAPGEHGAAGAPPRGASSAALPAPSGMRSRAGSASTRPGGRRP